MSAALSPTRYDTLRSTPNSADASSSMPGAGLRRLERMEAQRCPGGYDAIVAGCSYTESGGRRAFAAKHRVVDRREVVNGR